MSRRVQGRVGTCACAHPYTAHSAQPTLPCVQSISFVPLVSRGSFFLPAVLALTFWRGVGVILENQNWPALVLTQAPGQVKRVDVPSRV